MERKGLISIDALVSMILIISLIAWLHALVGAQTDDINVYGARLQSDYTVMQYGSMINNYYAANPTSGLKLEQPILKEFTKSLKREPIMEKRDNTLIIHQFEKFSYPVSSQVTDSSVEISRFFEYE